MRDEEIRALLRRYGWNATAYQLVNPGIDLWRDPAGEAAVGYVTASGVRVVAGAPVCAEDRLEAVVAAWESEAERVGEGVCYFGAAGRLHALLVDSPDHSCVVLGAQPVWEPARWVETIDSRASLRAQLARARNKGVTVSEWPVERATENPLLQRVITEWLQTRGLPPLHFLVEPQTLGRLTDKRVFVAERDGVPVGFVTCAPIPARNGWLTEQFVRGRNAPNGTVELMLDVAVRALASEGATYLTMGLVPLSENTWIPSDYNPLWLRFSLSWVRAHGRRFYNFAGLDAFKSKFRPHSWEPIFAISREAQFSPRTLWAIAGAFSGRSPLLAVGQGLSRAALQEWRWVRET